MIGNKSEFILINHDSPFRPTVLRSFKTRCTSIKSARNLLDLSASMTPSYKDADENLYVDTVNCIRYAVNNDDKIIYSQHYLYSDRWSLSFSSYLRVKLINYAKIFSLFSVKEAKKTIKINTQQLVYWGGLLAALVIYVANQ